MSNKKGPLSSKEKQYIERHYKAKTVDDISKRLKRSRFVVEKFIAGLSFERDEAGADKQVEETQPKEDTQTQNLFARKKERGVVIMTESASMAGDDSRTKRKDAANGIAPRYSRFIHKIKD
jgi:hypothetical protein